MAIDTTKLGKLAAEMMDRIADEYGDKVEEIGVCAVVVEIDVEEEEGDGYTEVLYRCTDGRRWIQKGLFDAARRAVFDSDKRPDEDDDED